MASQAAAAAMEASAAASKEREARAVAATQAAANKELMDRKTSVEWQLIQALSSPGSKVSHMCFVAEVNKKSPATSRMKYSRVGSGERALRSLQQRAQI